MIAALLGLTPGYFAIAAQWDIRYLRGPTVQVNDAAFHLDALEIASGSTIDAGQSFVRQALVAYGTGTAATDGSRIRQFHVSDKGRVYLLDPPLDMVDGRWQTTAFTPGRDTVELRFVRISATTEAVMADKAEHGQWDVSTLLPSDAVTLASIRVTALPTCAHLDGRKCQAASDMSDGSQP